MWLALNCVESGVGTHVPLTMVESFQLPLGGGLMRAIRLGLMMICGIPSYT